MIPRPDALARRAATGLLLTAIAWGILIVSAPLGLSRLPASSVLRPLLAAPYLAGSLICHQKPDRSFASAGVQWPVCGRCSGAYLGTAVGALVSLGLACRRLRGPGTTAGWRVLIVATIAPTAALWAAERTGMLHTTSLARAIVAVPLGLAIVWALRGVRCGYLR